MAVLIASLLLIFLFECSLAAVTRPTLSFKPNFLIIVVDDFKYTTNWDHSYPQGTTLANGNVVSYVDVFLPTIESFIDESIVFPRTYANPMCAVSRFSILTGRQAVRSEYSISQTLRSSTQDLTDGVLVDVARTKLYGTHDTVNNIPYVLKNYGGYETGMIGKWHLLSLDDNGHPSLVCRSLASESDSQKYTDCADILKEHGFDFVDGFYTGNIHKNMAEFSHNPEWMVAKAKNFIQSAVAGSTPFYLHFAHTITHLPNIWNTLSKFPDASFTPKGELNGEALLTRSGMSSRADIISRADNDGDIAGALWADDSVAALIKILEDEGVYDETFVVLMNEQGMGAKGSLYEQGTRMFQFIRFPPYFDTSTSGGTIVVPEDYIVSNMDLAAVLFDVAEIDDADLYDMDGVSWIDDVLEGVLQAGNGWLTNPSCCEYRYNDVYNSHSIVSKNWKYIYRANSVLTNDDIPDKYADASAVEQLYNLNTDPNEQENQINNELLIDTINEFQQLMRNYITNVVCTELSVECKMPDISSIAQQQENVNNYPHPHPHPQWPRPPSFMTSSFLASLNGFELAICILLLANLALLIVCIFKKNKGTARGSYSAVKFEQSDCECQCQCECEEKKQINVA